MASLLFRTMQSHVLLKGAWASSSTTLPAKKRWSWDEGDHPVLLHGLISWLSHWCDENSLDLSGMAGLILCQEIHTALQCTGLWQTCCLPGFTYTLHIWPNRLPYPCMRVDSQKPFYKYNITVTENNTFILFHITLQILELIFQPQTKKYDVYIDNQAP